LRKRVIRQFQQPLLIALSLFSLERKPQRGAIAGSEGTTAVFRSGCSAKEDALIEAMNVADDALLRDLRARGIKDRCKAELNLLARIEKAPMDSRERCELVWRILSDNSIEAIDEILKKKALDVSPAI
jgi:hypothetical protein